MVLATAGKLGLRVAQGMRMQKVYTNHPSNRHVLMAILA
jgi:hypothetical protein